MSPAPGWSLAPPGERIFPFALDARAGRPARIDTGAYFGYWRGSVWAVCDGTSSPQVVWVK